MNERTAQDFAIEHAEYMAQSAEHLIAAVNDLALAEQEHDEGSANASDVDAARDTLTEMLGGMRNSIHEFRKRRARAALAAQPGAVGEIYGYRYSRNGGRTWALMETDPTDIMPDEGGIVIPLVAAPTEAKPAQDAVDAEQIESAAKALASSMSYPWDSLLEEDRNMMRKTAEAIVRAAISSTKEQL